MQTSLNLFKRDPNGPTLNGLRVAGVIPGVIYGNKESSEIVQVPLIDLKKALAKHNALYNLTIDGKSHLAILKEIQAHPVTGKYEHISFQRVSRDKEIEIAVALHRKGHAQGEKLGAIITQFVSTLNIKCLPDKIPSEIIIDVTPLNPHEGLKVKDLTLPEGVRLGHVDPEQEVVICNFPHVAKEEPVTTTATAEAGAETAKAEGTATSDKKATAGDKKPEAGKAPAPAKDKK